MSGTAVYLRVSSEEQRERGSIATQRAEVERYIELHKITAPTWYEDNGISGMVQFELRPAGRQLLADARAGKVNRLLVYKVDRLARDTRIILSTIKVLEDLGVTIAATSEPFDSSTATGRFTTTIMAGVATLERENIRERAMAGINRLVRAGAWVGGIVPYGYCVEGKRGDARLIVSEQPAGAGLTESAVVRLIYSMIGNEGKSCVSIAEHLDRIGVAPAYARDAGRGKRVRRTSGRWRDSRIQYIVRSTTYRGVHRYGKHRDHEVIERPCPRIVDDALWERAGAALRRNFLFGKRNAKRQYLLRGLITCAHCGWTYTGTETREVRWYICGGRVQGKKGSGCHAKQINGAEIEDAVWRDVEGFLRNPGPVLDELARKLAMTESSAGSIATRLSEMRATLAGKDGELDQIVTLFRKQRIDEATLDRQLDEIEHERTGLAEEIKQLADATARARQAEGQLRDVASLLRELHRRLDEPLTWEVKRRLVETLVEGIRAETVGEGPQRDSHVSVSYRFAVSDASLAPYMPGRAGRNNALPQQAVIERAYRLPAGHASGGST